jgi:hypothetical protein
MDVASPIVVALEIVQVGFTAAVFGAIEYASPPP